MINPGTYFKADPNIGWTVVVIDERRNEYQLAGPFPTMEDAVWGAMTARDEPLLIPFAHP